MPVQFQAVPSEENRLWDAFILYSEQEVKYKINNPFGGGNDKEAYRLKLEYLQDLLKAYKRKLSKPERTTRLFLQNEVRKLKIKVQPSIWRYLLHGRLSRFLTNYLLNRHQKVQGHAQQFKLFQKSVGQEQNLTNLTTQMKQAGFMQNYDHVVQKMLQQDLPKFHLRYTDVQNPTTDFVLHFKKIPGSSTYSLEKFDAAARVSWEQVNRVGASTNWMSFPLLSQETYTSKEAANLMAGRSICKSDDTWIVLDRTNPQNPYKTIQFNLEEALRELPLSKMNALDVKNLISALQKGEVKETALKINGNIINYKLYANPADKSIRVLDSNNRLVDIKQIEQSTKQQSQKTAQILNKAEDNVVKVNFRKAIR